MGLGFKAKELINELQTLKTNDEEKVLIMKFEKFLISEANFKEYILQQIRELIQNNKHLRQLNRKIQLQLHHHTGVFTHQQVNDFRLNFRSTTQDIKINMKKEIIKILWKWSMDKKIDQYLYEDMATELTNIFEFFLIIVKMSKEEKILK